MQHWKLFLLLPSVLVHSWRNDSSHARGNAIEVDRNGSSDLDVLHSRLISAMLPQQDAHNINARVQAAAQRYANSMSADGHWKDVDYQTKGLSGRS